MNFDFFTTSDMLGKVFWTCAIGGTLFFILRVIIMIVGGDIDDNIDGVEVGDSDGSLDASDIAFEIFSINSITAFIMMFGWSGLTAYIQYKLSSMLSIFIALMVGIFALLITAYLFKIAMKLVSRGEQFKLEDVIGMNAKVYQEIPANGSGKVQIEVPGGMTREVLAISADKAFIESFKMVKIISVVDSNTIAVRKI